MCVNIFGGSCSGDGGGVLTSLRVVPSQWHKYLHRESERARYFINFNINMQNMFGLCALSRCVNDEQKNFLLGCRGFVEVCCVYVSTNL